MQKTKHLHVSVSQKIIIGLVLNTIFTIVEFIVGYAISSLALISDASNNLCDVISLANSYLAQKIAARPPTHRKTFGYARAGLLSAIINCFILCSLAIGLIYHGITKIMYPEALDGAIVLMVGAVGIFINGGVALSLKKHTADISIKSSYINLIVDAAASAGAVMAGIIMMLTEWLWVDAAISLGIAGILCYNAFNLNIQILHTFFDGVPAHLSLNDVESYLSSQQLAIQISKLHIWSNSHQTFLTCVILSHQDNVHAVLRALPTIKEVLHEKFSIDRATIEVQVNEQHAVNEPMQASKKESGHHEISY